MSVNTWTLGEQTVNVDVSLIDDDVCVKIGEHISTLKCMAKTPDKLILKEGDQQIVVWYACREQDIWISIDGQSVCCTRQSLFERVARSGLMQQSGSIRSPMPGRIIKIHVATEQHVEVGQPILVIEAMKMQNELKATQTGRIQSIYVSEGDSVEARMVLVTIVPES